jgi:guanylate kinase
MLNNKKGILIVFSGPSGVGKNTVRRLFECNPQLNLKFSVSTTTRKKRPEEEHGKEYFFVNEEEFNKQKEEGSFLENAEFAGYQYGTSKKQINEMLEKGYNVLLEIEVQGAIQVMEKVDRYLSIFLTPPSFEELERRLRYRNTESEEKIRLRLIKAKLEMADSNKYEHNVINDDPARAAQEISNIILNEINGKVNNDK